MIWKRISKGVPTYYFINLIVFIIQLYNLTWFYISEITRLQGGGIFYGDDVKFLDVYREKCTRITIRVLVPVREHPKVGR